MAGIQNLLSAALGGAKPGPAEGQDTAGPGVFSSTADMGMSPDGLAEVGVAFADQGDQGPLAGRPQSSRAARVQRRQGRSA